ncbi:MAG: hypothetical protein NTV05_12590 [Acidobacteria bacterium]|nr:hypothetical protein [Acidobacteriota bacterium]
MFRSSRTHFFVSLLSLVCILGALDYAQNAPQSPVTADDFNQFGWRWVGPMTFSGRISGIAVPRGQSQTYYVLGGTGGVWKTIDGGIHFEPIFEKYGTESMGWMAIAPSNQNILYLGTGEPMHARASTHGNGMWKSTDAGKTWTHIGLEKSYFIPMIAVDSRNPDIVYAAAEGKLYSNDMDCERGLFKSINGGKTWTNLGPMKDRGVGDFVIDPQNSNIVIASAYKHYRRAWTYDDRDADNGLFKTTDGGKTWSRLAGGLPAQGTPTGRTGLTIFEKNPKIVYARMDEEIVVGFREGDGVANFRAASAASGRGGGGGGGGRGGAMGTVLFGDGFTIEKFKGFTINAELAALAPKFVPVTGATEADLVTKFNALVGDKDFVTRSGVDVAKLQAAARKALASDKDLMLNITEMTKLMAKPAAAADSSEAKGRFQLINRHVLEILYSGALANIAPVKMNGMIYRTDDQGRTWKRMTEYKVAAPAGPPVPQVNDSDLDAAAQAREDETNETREALGIQQQTPPVIKSPAIVNPQLPPAQPAGRGQATPTPASAVAATQPAGRGAAQVGSAQVNQTEGGYYGRIWVDQTDDKVLYCGDTNTTVSKDAGKTLTVAQWDRGNGKTHVDHRVVWADPLNGQHILSGNDGGLSESWDGGEHWSQKSTINVQQFYDVSVDNEMPYNLMGGTQDNGAWLGPSQNRNSYGLFGNDWTYLPTGDAFYVVRDWWNPEYIYYESQFGGSSRMNLNTGEASTLAVRLTPQQTAAGEPALRYQWNAPIVLSPHNPGIVYIASQYVWKSVSRGAQGTFVRISPDLSKADKTKLDEARKTNLQWATVYTVSESPRKPGLLWAGTDDGNVWVTSDGGNKWVSITDQFYDAGCKPKAGVKGDLIPCDRWVKRVVASAFDENTAYLGFSGYRSHSEDKTWLFVTKDLGKTWTNISGGMDAAIFDVEQDPENASVLYLGTEKGIFVTIDEGKAWTAFSTSAPNTVIRDMAIQKRDREMAIATYGRGFYIVDIGPIKEFKADVFQQNAYLFDIKNTVKWNRFERRGDTLGEMAKADNPRVGQNIYYYLKADAKTVTVTIKDLEGNQIAELSQSSAEALRPSIKKGLQKVFWGLNRVAAGAPAAGGRGGAGGGGGGGRGGGGMMVDAGVYKVTFAVDGKEIATKKMTVSPDPLFK